MKTPSRLVEQPASLSLTAPPALRRARVRLLPQVVVKPGPASRPLLQPARPPSPTSSASAARLSLSSFVSLSSYFWNNVWLSLHNSTHWVYSNLCLLLACWRLYVYIAYACIWPFLVLFAFCPSAFSFAALPWLPPPQSNSCSAICSRGSAWPIGEGEVL